MHLSAAGNLLALAWPASGIVLPLSWPKVVRHQGISMLNHALGLFRWSFDAIDRVAKPWTFVVFTGVALKLIDKQAWSRPVAFDADRGFAVVHATHLASAASGLPLAVVSRLRLR